MIIAFIALVIIVLPALRLRCCQSLQRYYTQQRKCRAGNAGTITTTERGRNDRKA